MKQAFAYYSDLTTNKSQISKKWDSYNSFNFFHLLPSTIMRNKLLVFFLTLVFFGRVGVYAQGCFAPAAVCHNSAFIFAPAGPAGLPPNLFVSNPTFGAPVCSALNLGCQYNDAVNPQWLLIEVTAPGLLGFNLGAPGSANVQNGFLHWTLYPYNVATTCNDIFGDVLPPIACNFNNSTNGGTGFGPTYPAGAIATANYCINNYPVNAGDQFLLLVSNDNGTNTVISFNSTGSAQLGCSPFSVAAGTVCPNQVETVTPSWPGYTNLNYTITPQTTNVPNYQAGATFTVSAPTTEVFTVTARGTSPYGQLTSAIQVFTLTINPSATIAVAHATDYCYGSCADIVVSPAAATFSVNGPLSGPIYNFSVANTNTISLCNPALLSPNANGVYFFSATLTTGCIGTTTAQINVSPNNQITVPAAPIQACQGANVTLQANLLGATNYTWSGPCLNNTATNNGNNGNINLNNVQPNCAGIYTVYSFLPYNTVLCPRVSTVGLVVLQTYSVTIPPSYTLCQGAPLTLSASAFSAGSYSWTGPFFTANGVQNPLVTNSVLPANYNQLGIEGNYVVTANFSNGSITCPRTNTLVVNVVPINQVIVITPSLVCQYATSYLFVSGAGASSYSWTGPAGFTSTLSNPIISNTALNATGTYTGMATWSSGTVSCSAYGYNNITVVPVNSITILPPPPVCQPSNVGLLANALGAISYSWSGPNGFSASIPNPVLYYPPLSATGVYSVTTVFNSGGITCSNTETVYVSVNPVLSYTLPGFLRSCVGLPMTVEGPAGATSYTWSSSSGLPITAPNSQTLSINSLLEEHSGVYTLNASLGPCITSKQVEIQVFTAVTFTNASLEYTTCAAIDKTLAVGAAGGSGNYAYNWLPEAYLSTPTGSVVVVKPLGTTIYNVTVIDLACPSRTVNQAVPVTVLRAPLPNLKFDNLQGCEPFDVVLNPGLTPDENVILTYDFGGVKKIQVRDSLFTYPNLEPPGTYKLRIFSTARINAFTCSDSVDIETPVIVHPKARSDIQWTPEVPNTTDSYVTFNSYSRANANVEVFDWSFGGTGNGFDSDSSTNPQRKYDQIGKYPIMLISTTDHGCVDTTIEFLDIRDDMNVFIPNTFTPNNDGVNDVFQVKGMGFKPEGFTMEVFDRWGHMVYFGRDVTKGWDGTVKGGTPVEGVYIYRVKAIGTNGEGRKEFSGHVTLIR